MVRFSLIALFVVSLSAGIAQTAPSVYRVTFTDKDNTPYSLSDPLEFLSQRALDRRSAQNIPLDQSDLPVDPVYITQLSAAASMEVIHASKWFNSVTFRSTDSLGLDTIHQLPFVAFFRQTKGKANNTHRDKFRERKSANGDYYNSVYGGSARQITMLNLHLLHDKGAMGEGMLIGVLDSGFDYTDTIPAFKHLFDDNRIILTRDVPDRETNVYNDHTHGMAVLSTMAADSSGVVAGTAPKASYALIRTEVVGSEFPWEEDNWIVGAEICDSLGCDIINTSLGYTTFDDSTQNHSYSDLDGETLRISIAAGMAAQKGMIPVNSAGNEGNSDWYHISAPADAKNILTVGAVTPDRTSASFSSHGPAADGRVKPDVATVGEGAFGLHQWGMGSINGTSFSSPILAGSVACLWQLHRERSASEIMDAVRNSAHLRHDPNDDMGFGIPDLYLADRLLDDDPYQVAVNELVRVFPNGFEDHFFLQLYSEDQTSVRVEMFGPSGQKILDRVIGIDREHFSQVRIGDSILNSLPQAVYPIRITLGQVVMYRKLLKR